MRARILAGMALASTTAVAANNSSFVTAKPGTGSTQVTIYNGGFATVKETRKLDLKKGENEVRMTDVTSMLEPDSVVLRDVKRAEALRVLEQNYEANPLSETNLLEQNEGKVLDFEYTSPQTGERFYVKGKLIRAPMNPNNPSPYDDTVRGGMFSDAIVEADGKLMFGLPGRPRFELLGPDAILKPTLLWKLASEMEGPRDVEVSYLTGGLKWDAAYNLVAEEKGDNFDLVGWVTLENRSGKDLLGSQVKLVAGDVARAQPQPQPRGYGMAMDKTAAGDTGVTERSFEEYHLYALPRPTDIRDREVKQVEFVRASNVPAKRIYVFDVSRPVPVPRRYMANPGGEQSTQPVSTVLEIENKEASHLGMPLPQGKVKVYRRDTDGRNEFVGEDAIDHTPKDEKLRITLGNAFDIVGERRQTEQRNPSDKQLIESYEIKLRNHKTSDVEVRVVEHLVRGREWEVSAKSREFTKVDATTVEFRVPVKANGESSFTYTVRYKF